MTSQIFLDDSNEYFLFLHIHLQFFLRRFTCLSRIAKRSVAFGVFLEKSPSTEIKPHRLFARLNWKMMSNRAVGSRSQRYYWVFEAYQQNGAVWQPRPHVYDLLVTVTVVIYLIVSPLFWEIWSGFTGTLRAPGAVRHLFEVRYVICSISASRKAGAASDG